MLWADVYEELTSLIDAKLHAEALHTLNSKEAGDFESRDFRIV